MKVCQYIDKLLYLSKDIKLWKKNIKETFDKNKQDISEKMDIQLFFFKGGMVMPKWDLNLNTVWENENENYK